ncbi:MAG: tetratricopeptide repeat protein [Acidimicrobiales bacterium]
MKRTPQQIRDEITLREASLADARRELEAGELTRLQAATIEAREELALRRAYEELGDVTDDAARRRPTRRRRRWVLLVGLGCFLVAIIVILWSSLAVRQAGNSVTGNVSLSPAQHVTQLLLQAEADVAGGNVVAALTAYQDVLILSPKNVAALTQTGWLDFSAGSSNTNPTLVSLGIKNLRKAITYAPADPAPRLYYAIVADSTPGNGALAKSEFKVFLALKPSAAQLAVARPFLAGLGLSTS